MPVKRDQGSAPGKFGATIRKYRQEIGLTQAQLASALGLAPASIYRYEAGLSTPDVGALQKLYIHADGASNELAKAMFFEAICEKTGLDPAQFQTLLSGPRPARASPSKTFTIEGGPLTPREWLLAIALVLMTRKNTDHSADKMIRLLLEPWMKEAKEEYDRRFPATFKVEEENPELTTRKHTASKF
jgi:transcriptional regulator with XRE-family HTH domain